MRVVVTGSNGQVGLEVAERAGGGIGSVDVDLARSDARAHHRHRARCRRALRRVHGCRRLRERPRPGHARQRRRRAGGGRRRRCVRRLRRRRLDRLRLRRHEDVALRRERRTPSAQRVRPLEARGRAGRRPRPARRRAHVMGLWTGRPQHGEDDPALDARGHADAIRRRPAWPPDDRLRPRGRVARRSPRSAAPGSGTSPIRAR